MGTEAGLIGLLAAGTIAAYLAARGVCQRVRHPAVHPVFLSAGLIVAGLSGLGLTFDAYRPAQELLTMPLGPATVALALPVYAQRARLRSALLPLAVGALLGSAATMTAVVAFAALGGVAAAVLPALALKSATAAIAVEIARLRGADPALTAAFVVMTGTLGAMVGPTVLTWCRVGHPVARGVGLGTVSHAQGTAAALAESEAAGATSSLAMVAAALTTALLAPLYLPWLLAFVGG